jgi:hypothetical protein
MERGIRAVKDPEPRDLLGHAGFTDITLSGAFDGRPFSSDLDDLVVTAKRP